MQPRILKFIQIFAPLAVFLSAVFVAVAIGVERKPWWQDAFGLIGGGTLGALLGWGFFIFVGAVGWVSGPIFGAIGAIGIVVGGALGGMGLGSVVDKIVDVALDPGKFDFHTPIVLFVLAAGCIAGVTIYVFVGRRMESLKAGSPSAEQAQRPGSR